MYLFDITKKKKKKKKKDPTNKKHNIQKVYDKISTLSSGFRHTTKSTYFRNNGKKILLLTKRGRQGIN